MPRSSKTKKAIAIAKSSNNLDNCCLKEFKVRHNHVVFCESKKEFKNFLRNMLCKICDSRCIEYSNAEIRSYSKKELKILINKYDYKLYNAHNKANRMYTTSTIY